MPLPAPLLDDRRQEDLFLEARQLIQRYAPQWTDWNESDPGITILQLVAWMTDQTIFRLNQVPDLLYVKFLDLLGIRLLPATAATTHLVFTPTQPAPPSVLVPTRTRVAAEPVDDTTRPPVFETDRALLAIGAPLQAIWRHDTTRYEDLTAENAGPNGFQPFGPVLREGSSLLVGFALDPPLPAGEIALLAIPASDPSGRLVQTCAGSEAPVEPPSELVWEGWDGSLWRAVAQNSDESAAFTRAGYVRLVLTANQLSPITLDGDTTARRWLRARLVRNGYQRPPRLALLLPNAVPAAQAQTVEGEILGGSTGLSDQVVQLASTPVIPGTLVVEIDEGSGPQQWREVPDLAATGPGDEVYLVDHATGLVTFGTGERGRPPVANPANPTGNIVAVSYRWGGGPGGNLPPGSIDQLQSPVDGIASVTNPVSAAGGRETETVEAAKLRAPAELAAASRAVTVADFEHFAKQTEGALVGRAIARPLMHPEFPGVEVPGSVTVIVIPDVEGPAPQPTATTLRAVCRTLDRRRLLTTELHVVGPSYRRIRVSADIVVLPTEDLGVVRGAVAAALDSYFHPLHGGDAGQGWPLGGAVFFSMVHHRIFSAHSGVSRVEEVVISLDDREAPPCTDIEIGALELLQADGHDVQVRYP